MTTLEDLAYRAATVDVVVGAAQQDLNGLWQSLLRDDAEAAAMGLRRAVPEVAREYGNLAGDNALIWYEDLRPSGGRSYRGQTFTPPSLAQAQGLATWAVTPLFSGDITAAWSRLAGTIQRLVTDHDRVTIEENVARDPVARGWRRVAPADACAFCAYMTVKVDDASVDKFHDHCRCKPAMLFDGDTLPEQPNFDEWELAFDQAHHAIEQERREIPGYWKLKRRARSQQYPELQLTTKNILARARRLEPDLFRDGVRAAA